MYIVQVNKKLEENEITIQHAYQYYIHAPNKIFPDEMQRTSTCYQNFYYSKTDSILLVDNEDD